MTASWWTVKGPAQWRDVTAMIRKIWFPEELLSNVGLGPKGHAMAGLGRLVVLAGPNGAGKSRYLQVLQRVVSNAQGARRTRTTLETEISSLEGASGENFLLRLHNQQLLESTRAELAKLREAWTFRASEQLDLTNADSEHIVELTYQLNKAGIPRAEAMPPANAVHLARGNISPGFGTAHASMHAYFAYVARSLWNDDDPRIKMQPSVARDVSDAGAFNRMLDLLVGGRIEPTLDENQDVRPLYRGRPFNPAELSDGEAVLVTWAIILHRQKDALADAIVLIDEPENHLHPDACIRALRALRDEILGPHGQIWLATHSVQLIAFGGMDSVWLVDGGCVEYAGNKVDKVIERLLGGEEGRDQLRAFLADADALGFYNFAAECLLEPTVAAAKPDDPQEAQFVRLVRERLGRGEPLNLLDYGAGKGRLASALREARARRDDAPKAVDLAYHAYNGAQSPLGEVEECRARVADLGKLPGVRAEYVDDLRKLQLETSTKMDLVVLCNVLHEIRIDRWLPAFESIAGLLSSGGSLLLMEDQQMRVGELPTAHGFVVLDVIEVAALFGAKLGDEVRELSTAHGTRLTQIEVSARVLRNANAVRLKDALGKVEERAREQVERLRDNNARSFQTGRLHAYYSMLYMNAMLARRTFG